MSDVNKAITLELGNSESLLPDTEPKAVVHGEKEMDSVSPEETELSEDEQKMVEDFSQKIDLKDSAVVLQYGSACQKKLAAFSDSALEGVKTKDLGETGDMIAELVAELKGFSADEEKGGFLGLFKKADNQITRLKARYNKVEANVERIAGELKDHQNRLLADIVMLDKMYDANLAYFKELTMYIMAGKKKLAQERSETLPAMREKARISGQAHDAQAANDFDSMCDRFEKKLYDLELTRTISIQMAPQIRLIQNNNAVMSEKIQSTVNNTIPLWKNQMVLALGMMHSRQAMEAQRKASDLTNGLLRKNAEELKAGTVEIAQESERGIVDIETLKVTNEQLIGTLDEVLRIQDEGRRKRREAEEELGRIEGELKQKLLEIR